MRRLTFLLAAGAAALVSVLAAAAAGPRDLPMTETFHGNWHTTKLASGVAYQASVFPIGLRVTPPDASWAGAQWKDATWPKVAPFYGWAAIDQGGTNPNVPPRGEIAILTSYARTPSVAATVATLRTRGRGASYEATSTTTLGGFPAVQFDAQITGKFHQFLPFSKPTSKAEPHGDSYGADQGQHLHIIVAGVRGKTIVVFMNNVSLSADQFPTFLAKADAVLETLKFPG
jgi:hypothetical protein